MSDTVWNRGPLASWDTETTGTNVESDRIVTAALVTQAGTREWLSDVDGVEIPAEASAVHGVSTEHARAHGRPAKVVVDEIAEALAVELRNGAALVVMNAPFDLTILDRECTRHGVATLTDRLDGCPIGPVIDPLILDRTADKWRKGKRTLTDLTAHYKVDLTDAHTAGADAEAALKVALRIADKYPQLQAPAELVHKWQIGWFKTWAEGLEQHLRKKDPEAFIDRNWPLAPAPEFGDATPADVLRLRAQGHDYPAIAELLPVTVRESRLLLQQAMTELGAANEVHAVALAIAAGLLPHDIATRRS